MMTSHPTTRAIAASLAILVVLPVLVAPRPARAFVFVDPLNLVQNTITAVHDTKASLDEFVLDPLAIILAKTAIRSITQSTVNWINSGFNGSPAFVTDLNTNLRQLGDAVAQDFLVELANNQAVHSPFIDQLVTNVGAGYYLYSSRDALAAQLHYTLDQSAQDDAAFLAGDFNQGGWNAWFSSFMNPANNPYGAQMIASQALASRVSSAANQRVEELGWGSGFLSWRGECTNTTTGQTGVSFDDADPSIKCKVQTPGTTIEHALNITNESPLHQLEIANSIDQVVGALAQQLISQMLGGSGLRGASQPAAGGGASPVTQATGDDSSDSGARANVSGSFVQTIATTQTQVRAYQQNWQTVQSAARAALTRCFSQTAEVQSVLDRADAAISNANAALASLASLQTEATAAANASGSTQASLLSRLSANYQRLLSGGTLPTEAQMAQASYDGKDSGTDTPVSLLTQLTSCNVGSDT